MPAPENPYQPYSAQHENLGGPGDSRPSSVQVVKDEDMLGKLNGKVMLITGCSSGIGVETARALYETGAKLYLTARDIPKLEAVIKDIVDKASIQPENAARPEALKINLDSLASVRAGAEEFKRRSSQLHVIINNAGVMAVPYGKTEDGFETHIGINHMSHFLLFQLLKPLLLASGAPGDPSRVINVSSAGHRFWNAALLEDVNWNSFPEKYSKFSGYGQSKTANIYMANALTRRFADQGLIGLSLHPGIIMTELGRYMDPEEMDQLLKAGPGGLEGFKKMQKTPEQGAATSVFAAVSKHFNDVANGGRYLADVGEAGAVTEVTSGAPGYAEHVYGHEGDEEKLWKISCEAVGVPLE